GCWILEISVPRIERQGVAFKVDIDSIESELVYNGADRTHKALYVVVCVQLDQAVCPAYGKHDFLSPAVQGSDVRDELRLAFQGVHFEADGRSRTRNRRRERNVDDVKLVRYFSELNEPGGVYEIMPITDEQRAIAGI